jgi:hypothetical protein
MTIAAGRKTGSAKSDIAWLDRISYSTAVCTNAGSTYEYAAGVAGLCGG